jgi:hypothetical protein
LLRHSDFWWVNCSLRERAAEAPPQLHWPTLHGKGAPLLRIENWFHIINDRLIISGRLSAFARFRLFLDLLDLFSYIYFDTDIDIYGKYSGLRSAKTPFTVYAWPRFYTCTPRLPTLISRRDWRATRRRCYYIRIYFKYYLFLPPPPIQNHLSCCTAPPMHRQPKCLTSTTT